jgi:hypothetical protein
MPLLVQGIYRLTGAGIDLSLCTISKLVSARSEKVEANAERKNEVIRTVQLVCEESLRFGKKNRRVPCPLYRV